MEAVKSLEKALFLLNDLSDHAVCMTNKDLDLIIGYADEPIWWEYSFSATYDGCGYLVPRPETR